MYPFLSRHKRTFFALIAAFFYAAAISYATPPVSPYTPAETLDPSCAPGDTNCSVLIYPDQTGNTGEFLTTDGTTVSWATIPASSNIYNTDGSLTGARTLTLSGNTLDIAGTTTSRFFANGNVAIGTTTDDGYKLRVQGNTRVTNGQLTVVGTGLLGGATQSDFSSALASTFQINHGSGNYGLQVINSSTANSGANLTLFKTRGASVASTLGPIVNQDRIGNIYFMAVAANGVNTSIAAKITAYGYPTGGFSYLGNGAVPPNTSVPGMLEFATTGLNGVQDVSRMRLLPDGELMLGDGSIQPLNNYYRLQVNGSGYYTGKLLVGAPFATTSIADTSSVLDIRSTTAGALLPRMTNAQRAAIATPATGLLAYSTDATEGMYVNLSGGWQRFLTTADTSSLTNIYTADGSLTGARVLTLNANTLDIAGTTTTRFFANGNVGIGTTTDSGDKLSVNGSALVAHNIGSYTPTLTLSNTGGYALLRLDGVGSNYWDIGSAFQTSDSDLVFSMSLSEKARFASSGNFLINTTTDAGYKLDVNGAGRFTGILNTDSSLSVGQNARIRFAQNDGWGYLGQAFGWYYQGGATFPFKISDASLLVGWNTLGGNYGTGNLFVNGNTILGSNVDSGSYKLDVIGDVRIRSGSATMVIEDIAGTYTRLSNGGGTSFVEFGGNDAYFHQGDVNFSNASGAVKFYGGVKIGSGSAPHASAILDISSISKGVLFPRMTDAERTTIATPATGLQLYQTDSVEGQYVKLSGSWQRFLTTADIGTTITVNPAGADTQIQFNNGGAFGASSGLTWNNTTNTLRTSGVFQKILTTDTNSVIDMKIGTGYELYGTPHGSGGYIAYLTGGTGGDWQSGWQFVIGSETNKIATFTTGGIAIAGSASFGNTVTFPANLQTYQSSPNQGFSFPSGNGWNFVLRGSSAEFLRLTNAGNLLINTTTDAGYKLDVNGTLRSGAYTNSATGNAISLVSTGRIHWDNREVSLGEGASSVYEGIAIGYYANAGASKSVIIGKNLSAGGNGNVVMIGGSEGGLSAAHSGLVSINSSSVNGISIVGFSNHNSGIAIGQTAQALNAAFEGNMAIGLGAGADGVYAIALGSYSQAGSNEFVAGSRDKPITNVYFGGGNQSINRGVGAGTSYTINGSGAYGTDFAGGNITLAGGKGTGSGTPGHIIFSTASAGGSGTTLQTLTERARFVGATGNFLLGTTTDNGYKLNVQGSIHASGDGSSVAYWVPNGVAIRGTAATGGTMYIDGSQDSSGTINLRATSIVASGAFSATSIASGSINVTGDYVRVSNGPNPPSFRLNNSTSGADWYIETHRGAPSGSLEITNSLGTAGLTIFSDRNVAINSNTNSGHKLQVTGTVSLASLTVAGSSQDALCIVNGGTEVQRNNGAQTCTVSSARFKHDINPLSGDILNTLSQFTPSTFIYNDQTNLRIGLIAEQVATIDPRLVFYEEDGVTPRGVRYEDLSVMTLKGVQEVIVSMNSLETLTTPNTLRASLTAWLGSIENGIGKIFAKKVETEELCIKKSNGTLICVTGDQLEQFITTQNTIPASATIPSENTTSNEGAVDENISINTQEEVVVIENPEQEIQEEVAVPQEEGFSTE